MNEKLFKHEILYMIGKVRTRQLLADGRIWKPPPSPRGGDMEVFDV